LSVHGKLLRFRRPEHETLETKQGATRAGAPACESGGSKGRGSGPSGCGIIPQDLRCACGAYGGPAALSPSEAVRPETLRPRLSTGLPLARRSTMRHALMWRLPGFLSVCLLINRAVVCVTVHTLAQDHRAQARAARQAGNFSRRAARIFPQHVGMSHSGDSRSSPSAEIQHARADQAQRAHRCPQSSGWVTSVTRSARS
jgi:hypothetical protein